MARKTIKEYVAKVDTKMEALVLVGNLLAGNIVVDVDTNEMTELTKNEQLFDTEFVDILKAFGIEKVPVEILARVGKRTDGDAEITIDDVTTEIDDITAKGLLNELYIGTTQVDATTGLIYWCYGGQDGVKHNYDTITACAGKHIGLYDVCDIYAESWLMADTKDKEAVEKLIELIRG